MPLTDSRSLTSLGHLVYIPRVRALPICYVTKCTRATLCISSEFFVLTFLSYDALYTIPGFVIAGKQESQCENYHDLEQMGYDYTPDAKWITRTLIRRVEE